MKRTYIAWLLVLAMILTATPCTAAAEAPMEVYTEFSRTSAEPGNGTKDSPYNLFEDALDAVAEGGTIYILGDGAFVNSSNDGSPLAISKPVTIAAAPGLGTRASFLVRTAGIVLGADVTFDHVILELVNGYRPVVCANGYTLTLNQTAYSPNARIVHLSGGTIYGYTVPKPGAHSRIIVTGKDSRYGNLYAGSINAQSDLPVDITVEQVAGANIGSIYACGALQGYYNSEDFMNPDNEPDFPSADSDKFPVWGAVSIHLDETGIRTVYGKTGGEHNAAVSVASQYLYSCALMDVDALEVTRGSFSPTALTNDSDNSADVTICEGALLDIGHETDGVPALGNLSVRTFTGGGTLLMGYDQTLTITGDCLGETEFRTRGGSLFQSNLVQPEFGYIKTTSGDGIFTFQPCYSQQGMTFTKHQDGWYTSAQPEIDATILSSFSIPEPVWFITQSELLENGIEIPVDATFAQGIADVGMTPYDYTVRFGGNEYAVPSVASTENDGYYEADIVPLSLNFAPFENIEEAKNVIFISNFSNVHGFLGDIAPGVYDIDITAPLQTGNTVCTVRLVVLRDGEPIPALTVNNTRGRITATYHNAAEHDIQNAVMMACAYDNTGALQAVLPAAEKLSVAAGGSQTFSFDMTDIPYDTVKVFAWNGFAGLFPLCGNYPG